ncbi:VanZ family protein [Collinsella tanakaei]|uniref:VanZ family protein n=1 Tax=Collinsella tanakaei TaxID=626935 RepID=UPI0025A47280|nr:VanZ family protein [Collinsella tanakaei]MDM8299643.1 VanZ family protein [Collinsella tanakaei]
MPWLIASVAMVALIWGNSLVPGEGSSSVSMAVVDAVRAVLDGCGIPSAWVTNFLVRKTAHFTEYAILGILIAQALDHDGRAPQARLLTIAALLVLVPSVDEGIQLFVSGRSGQVSDVLLDCCGAATGVAVRHLIRFGIRRGKASDGGGG